MRTVLPVVLLAFSIMLGGCATMHTHNPVPESYTGSLATIDDGFKIHDSKTANMFYIQRINDKDVLNTVRKSINASSGKGGLLYTKGHSHQLPTSKTKLLLTGAVVHGAPIGYLFNSGSNFEVSGEIEFIPEANKHYLISGELSKKRSAVWIENIKGNIVSDVIILLEGSESSTITPSSQFIRSVSVANNQEQNKTALFFKISGGESLARVTKKIGAPDSTSYDKGNFFTNRPSHIDYKYNGLGKIRFSSHDKKAQHVLRVFPEVGVNKEPLANQLESSGSTLQHVARAYYERDALSEEELDKIAETIWVNRNMEDDYTEDAVAWFMKVIGKQGNNRYYSLINTLTNRDQYSSKIARYANKVLKQLEPSSINQFKYAG